MGSWSRHHKTGHRLIAPTWRSFHLIDETATIRALVRMTRCAVSFSHWLPIRSTKILCRQCEIVSSPTRIGFGCGLLDRRSRCIEGIQACRFGGASQRLRFDQEPHLEHTVVSEKAHTLSRFIKTSASIGKDKRHCSPILWWRSAVAVRNDLRRENNPDLVRIAIWNDARSSIDLSVRRSVQRDI
jgi:hypothetical protein